jgi:hypothetical protein
MAPSCKTGPHSDSVDDADLRGYSLDEKGYNRGAVCNYCYIIILKNISALLSYISTYICMYVFSFKIIFSSSLDN